MSFEELAKANAVYVSKIMELERENNELRAELERLNKVIRILMAENMALSEAIGE